MLPETPDERRRRGAHRAIVASIARWVEDVDPAAFEVRPPWPGAEAVWGTRKAPLALPALTAAREVMMQAVRVEREAIEHARGQGKAWAEIGKALGAGFVKAAEQADMPLAEAAWRYAAYRVMPDQEIPWSYGSSRLEGARWRCWTCAAWVTEGHPDNGPDAEQGHTAGCERAAKRGRQGFRWT